VPERSRRDRLGRHPGLHGCDDHDRRERLAGDRREFPRPFRRLRRRAPGVSRTWHGCDGQGRDVLLGL
jgi:hypothetical protein